MARSHKEWEASKNEQYAEKWWNQNGFTWKLDKRFISKSVYTVEKDGATLTYEINNDPKMNMPKCMGVFLQYWELNLQYIRLRREAKEKGII